MDVFKDMHMLISVQVAENPAAVLEEYGNVPIAFRAESRFRVTLIHGGLGGIALVEEPVAEPYIKDYDAIPGEGPSTWARRWDISNWGILCAFDGDERVGGAVVSWKTEGLNTPEGAENLAVLWDLRVHPSYRGQGIGTMLFASALDWTRDRECRRIRVETQNINVPACRFYAGQGCELRTIDRFAYGDSLDEVQLLWYRDL